MSDAPTITVPCIGLRVPEAAAALGISQRKLYALLADRTCDIPRVRLGGVLLFPARELQTWLARQAGCEK